MSISHVFADHAKVTARAAEELPAVLERVVKVLDECFRGGHKVFACGNGGSAADAQHFVAELIGRFLHERRSLPAIALTADAATMTAIGNDYGYERVFARQLEGLAQSGDVLFAISTSGNSRNVIDATITARGRGCIVVGMTGERGGNLRRTWRRSFSFVRHRTSRPGSRRCTPSAFTPSRIRSMHSSKSGPHHE